MLGGYKKMVDNWVGFQVRFFLQFQFFFNYIIYFEGFCALCFMVGFCSYSYAFQCFSLCIVLLLIGTFHGFVLLFKLVLPPLLWLCTSVGELEAFSSFNSNFSIILFHISFSFKMFLCF
jgi:hypothetical protein